MVRVIYSMIGLEDDTMGGGSGGKEKTQGEYLPGLSKHRVEALSDGVYAIAMTIAVLNIDIAELPTWTSPETFFPALSVVWDQLLHYAIAFLTLGAFWVAHQQRFNYIRHVDRTFLWYCILSLFLIALIPFTTALAGDFNDIPFAVQAFGMNMMLIGICENAGWRHASAHHRLIDPALEDTWIIQSRRRGMVIPAVSLAVIFAAFFTPDWATALYLLTPFAHISMNVTGLHRNDKI
jgi:uncharacterized membrane protein